MQICVLQDAESPFAFLLTAEFKTQTSRDQTHVNFTTLMCDVCTREAEVDGERTLHGREQTHGVARCDRWRGETCQRTSDTDPPGSADSCSTNVHVKTVCVLVCPVTEIRREFDRLLSPRPQRSFHIISLRYEPPYEETRTTEAQRMASNSCFV